MDQPCRAAPEHLATHLVAQLHERAHRQRERLALRAEETCSYVPSQPMQEAGSQEAPS